VIPDSYRISVKDSFVIVVQQCWRLAAIKKFSDARVNSDCRNTRFLQMPEMSDWERALYNERVAWISGHDSTEK
jgi:hypothetical protein